MAPWGRPHRAVPPKGGAREGLVVGAHPTQSTEEGLPVPSLWSTALPASRSLYFSQSTFFSTACPHHFWNSYYYGNADAVGKRPEGSLPREFVFQRRWFDILSTFWSSCHASIPGDLSYWVGTGASECSADIALAGLGVLYLRSEQKWHRLLLVFVLFPQERMACCHFLGCRDDCLGMFCWL